MSAGGHRWALAIAAMLLAVAGLRMLADRAALGIAMLSVIPIVLAAFRFGRQGSLLAAGAALALFVLEELLHPSEDLPPEDLPFAAATRGIVFVGTALLVSQLLRRQLEQQGRLDAAAAEIEELGALRAALTPADFGQPAGLEVGAAYSPSEAPAGGDFLLVAPGQGGTTVLAVGDVAGHGVSAARRASFVRAVLATHAESTSDPARLLALANTILHESDPHSTHYVTAVVAVADTAAGRLSWAAAGHPAPWDLDTGRPLPAARSGVPLGIDRRLRCETSTVDLPAGAGVLLFTDGLYEARPGPGRAQLGEEAVRYEIQRIAPAAPGEVVGALQRLVDDHTGGHASDDLCLLAARSMGRPSPAPPPPPG